MTVIHRYDLAKVNTTTTGTGTITLGTAVPGFLTFGGAGVQNGETVAYSIRDGVNSETSTGVYTSSGTTLTRNSSGRVSTNGNAAISLTGNAQVSISPRAADFGTSANQALLLDDSARIPAVDGTLVLNVSTAGSIWGLTLSNSVGDATNDIDVSVGQCSDSTSAVTIKLSSGLTKRLDAGWAVGTNQGGLDTGAITDTSYHVHLIRRPDTGVVDALFSASATSPTLPANYTQFRRVGSLMRSSGTVTAFKQVGNYYYISPVIVYNSASAYSSQLTTMLMPHGIVARPMIQVSMQINDGGDASMYLGPAVIGTITAGVCSSNIAQDRNINYVEGPYTNTDAQIYLAVLVSSGTLIFSAISCAGWIDDRGRIG